MITKTDQLDAYLKRLFRDTPGVVYMMVMDQSLKRGRKWFNWPAQADDITTFTLQAAGQGWEVYVAPALFQPEAKELKVATQDQILGSWVCWADFDGTATEDWKSDVVPQPSWRIQSSTPDRQHCYWAFDTFQTDTTVIGLRNRAVAYYTDADRGGWDPGQLLRLPYTTNFGYAKNRKESYPVSISEETDRLFTTGEFSWVDGFTPTTLDPKMSWDNLPGVYETLAARQWTKPFLDLFFLRVDQLRPSRESGKVDRSKALLNVAYEAAKSGASDAEAVALVRDADDRWKKYSNRSDQDRQIMKLVERAREEHPFGDTVLTFDGLMLGEQTVYTAKELRGLEVHMEWLLDGLLPKGSFGVISGPPGVGKTSLGLRLSESLASGQPFLEHANTCSPQKVLFLSLEMGLIGMKQFLDVMDYGRDDHMVHDNMLIMPGSAMNLNRPEGRSALQAVLDRFQPQVLFIDSLGKIAGGKLSDDDIARDLMNYLDVLRAQYGLTIYLIHHSRKSQERNKHPDTLDDLYGSQYYAAGAEWVWMLTKENEKDNEIRFTQAKARYSGWIMPKILQRSETLNFKEVNPGGNDPSAARDAVAESSGDFS